MLILTIILIILIDIDNCIGDIIIIIRKQEAGGDYLFSDTETAPTGTEESIKKKESIISENQRTAHKLELESLYNRKLGLEYKEHTYREELKKDTLTTKERLTLEFNIAGVEKELEEIEARIEDIKTIIEQGKASESRHKHYDKYLAFRNIRELLKNTDIKLGQIEKEAGCQAGYMSRLEKTENATEPTVEFLVTAAQKLNVSLDDLLYVTISSLSSTEIYMIKFLEKLIRDTKADRLNWIKEPLYVFKEIEKSDDGELYHPLFSKYQNHKGLKGIAVSEAGLPYIKTRSFFPSKTFGQMTEVIDDCYRLELKDQTTLYVMSVGEIESDEQAKGKAATEIWMHRKNGKPSCLCTDHEGKEIIIQLIFKLWLAVNQYDTRPKINKEHREAIDSFLRDEIDDNIVYDLIDDQPE